MEYRGRREQRGQGEAGSSQRWQSHGGFGGKRRFLASCEDVTSKDLRKEKPWEELNNDLGSKTMRSFMSDRPSGNPDSSLPQQGLCWEQRPSHFLDGQRPYKLVKAKTGFAEALTPPPSFPTQAKAGTRCMRSSVPKGKGFLPKAVGVATLQPPLAVNINGNRCTLATTRQEHI